MNKDNISSVVCDVDLSINNMVPDIVLFLSFLNQAVLSQLENISASTQEFVWHFILTFPLITSGRLFNLLSKVPSLTPLNTNVGITLIPLSNI